MSSRRRCALALTVLGAALIALLLTPGPAAAPGRPAIARAALARTVVVAKHTHTHHTSSDYFPCSSRFSDWFPDACPTDTPGPGPTFSFTNSANDVSIPPTATPRPVQTPAPTPQDTPYPTDLPVGDGETTTSTTSASSGDLLPATGGSAGSGGGATGLWVLGGLVLLVLLGGTAGLAVLRLR